MDKVESLIRERHSVRSYLDKKIEKEKVTKLKELIKKINKEAKLNIQLVLNDGEVFDKFMLHYGRLENCKNYIALIGKKDDSLDEKIGYFGEQIVLKAQELGLNTCWVAGTYKKSAVKTEIGSNEKLIAVIALGYGKTKGHPRRSKTIEDVSISKDNPDWYQKGVEFALLAPTAINQQRFTFEYLGDIDVRAIAKRGHLTKVDLGIVKYHFELGANKEINWVK